MNPNEIVVHVVNRQRCDVVLYFFRERVCQASEPTHRHAHGEVLTFDITGRDVLRIRVPDLWFLLASDALRRRVAHIGAALIDRAAVHLHQDRIVHIAVKGLIDRKQVQPVTISAQLNAVCHAAREIVYKCLRRAPIAPTNPPEQTSLVSASIATQVQVSPACGFFSRILGVTLACLAPTKDQISSHCTLWHGKLTSDLLRYSEQAALSSTKSLATVFLATPVMRTVARIELPSTNAETTWICLALSSLFILNYYYIGQALGQVENGPFVSTEEQNSAVGKFTIERAEVRKQKGILLLKILDSCKILGEASYKINASNIHTKVLDDARSVYEGIENDGGLKKLIESIIEFKRLNERDEGLSNALRRYEID